MADTTPRIPAEPPEAVSLRQSRPAVLFLYAAAAVFSAGSAIAFGYQATYREDNGELFRDTPFAWFHLGGHLVRAAGAGATAWALRRYARSAKVGVGADTDRARLFADLELVWLCMGLFIGGHLAYTAIGFGLIVRAVS